MGNMTKLGDLRTKDRTAVISRQRYLEPGKKDGNPFFSLRIPRGLKAAVRKKWGKDATSKVRALMARAVGYSLSDNGDDE